MVEAVVFIRVSDKKKEPELGLDDLEGQRNEVRAIVKRLGATVLQTLELQDVSGDEVYDDARFHDRVLRHLTPNRVLIVRDLDRLIRAANFEFRALKHISKVGCKVYTKDGLADLSTATGRFSVGVTAQAAGLELERIRERTLSQRATLRASGLWVDGTPPTGLEWLRKTRSWRLTEDAPKIVEAFHRYAAGESLTAIGLSLPGKKPGTSMTRTGVYRLMKKSIYVDGHPSGLAPLIDRATWTTVQQRLEGKANGITRARATTTEAAPFSGFMAHTPAGPSGWVTFTGEATRHIMYGGHINSARTHTYYSCRCRSDRKAGLELCGLTPVRTTTLNSQVEDYLVTMTSDPQFSALAEVALKAPDSAEAKRADLTARLASLKEKKRRLAKMFADILMDEDEFIPQQKKVIADIGKVEADLAALAEAPTVTAEDVRALTRSWAFPKDGSPEAKRKWCQTYLQAVNVIPHGKGAVLLTSATVRVPLVKGGFATFSYAGGSVGIGYTTPPED